MERLTKRKLIELKNSQKIVCCNSKVEDCNANCVYGYCKWSEKAFQKLKELEDLEEQGLLLRLPYNLATCGKLYYVDEFNSEIYELTADKIEISKMMISGKFLYTIDCCEFVLEDFGKIVFKTKAEAEKALEMGCE